MTSPPPEEQAHTKALLDRAANGDGEAVAALLDRDRDRLRRMVEARLDRRLRTRVDVSDVLQDVTLEAARRLPRYTERREMPFFLWLRFLTAQHMAELCRRHLGADLRDVRRETDGEVLYGASSADCLAAQFAAEQTSPTQAAVRAERRMLVEHALAQLEPADREVLSLRHFEQLSNLEVARELGLEPSAASKRYLRALTRLRGMIDSSLGDSGPDRR